MKKFNFNQFFLNSILEMKTKGLARDLKLIKRIDPIRIKYKGKTLINLSSNDYLGLSQNKIIKNYTKKIIDNYGIGSGSSRLISGNFDFHEKVEDLLAKKKLRDIRPSQFSRNEIKAAKAAETAMKKGDTLAAIKAKKSQLLNNQLAKEALEIHKTFDKAQKDKIEPSEQELLEEYKVTKADFEHEELRNISFVSWKK